MEFYFHELDESVLILSADGGLNADTAGEFVGQLERMVDAGVTKIIVDCTRLEYISSYGIGVLVRLHKRLAQHGGDVKIAAARSMVLQALTLLRMGKLFEIYPDVNQARLAFRDKGSKLRASRGGDAEGGELRTAVGPKRISSDPVLSPGWFRRNLMSRSLPIVFLARHGETAWTITGQHTGQRSDLPLTARGERNARRLGERLGGLAFARVWTSPLQRAARTCELAGYKNVAEVDGDLVEWDYGQYEGRTGAQIRAARPDWDVFRDGCPGGETPDQIAARADRVIARVRAAATDAAARTAADAATHAPPLPARSVDAQPAPADVLLFSSGHFLRILTARWLGLDASAGRFFLLDTASLSALSYEHNESKPAVRFWNDTRHVGE